MHVYEYTLKDTRKSISKGCRRHRCATAGVTAGTA